MLKLRLSLYALLVLYRSLLDASLLAGLNVTTYEQTRNSHEQKCVTQHISDFLITLLGK